MGYFITGMLFYFFPIKTVVCAMNSGLCLNSQDFVGLSRNMESLRPAEASK